MIGERRFAPRRRLSQILAYWARTIPGRQDWGSAPLEHPANDPGCHVWQHDCRIDSLYVVLLEKNI